MPTWLVVVLVLFFGCAICSGAVNGITSAGKGVDNNTTTSANATPTIDATATQVGATTATQVAQDTQATQDAQPTNTPQPTDTPIPTTWTTTHKYTGSGIKKTAIFTVPDDWKITWSCDPSSFYGSEYNVQVYVYNSDGTPADVAINEICKKGNTNGETEEHQGGDVYLEINSEGSWNIQVQELQ